VPESPLNTFFNQLISLVRWGVSVIEEALPPKSPKEFWLFVKPMRLTNVMILKASR